MMDAVEVKKDEIGYNSNDEHESCLISMQCKQPRKLFCYLYGNKFNTLYQENALCMGERGCSYLAPDC